MEGNTACGIQWTEVQISASLLSNQVTTLSLSFLTWKMGIVTERVAVQLT